MHKSQSQQTTKSIVKHKNYEGVEALRQIATTSLFLENEEEKTSTNRIVPIIKEPEKIEGKFIRSYRYTDSRLV
jgi:phosphoribosylformylglycinamidine (FGAM) synthase PurS component